MTNAKRFVQQAASIAYLVILSSLWTVKCNSAFDDIVKVSSASPTVSLLPFQLELGPLLCSQEEMSSLRKDVFSNTTISFLQTWLHESFGAGARGEFIELNLKITDVNGKMADHTSISDRQRQRRHVRRADIRGHRHLRLTARRKRTHAIILVFQFQGTAYFKYKDGRPDSGEIENAIGNKLDEGGDDEILNAIVTESRRYNDSNVCFGSDAHGDSEMTLTYKTRGGNLILHDAAARGESSTSEDDPVETPHLASSKDSVETPHLASTNDSVPVSMTLNTTELCLVLGIVLCAIVLIGMIVIPYCQKRFGESPFWESPDIISSAPCHDKYERKKARDARASVDESQNKSLTKGVAEPQPSPPSSLGTPKSKNSSKMRTPIIKKESQTEEHCTSRQSSIDTTEAGQSKDSFDGQDELHKNNAMLTINPDDSAHSCEDEDISEETFDARLALEERSGIINLSSIPGPLECKTSSDSTSFTRLNVSWNTGSITHVKAGATSSDIGSVSTEMTCNKKRNACPRIRPNFHLQLMRGVVSSRKGDAKQGLASQDVMTGSWSPMTKQGSSTILEIASHDGMKGDSVSLQTYTRFDSSRSINTRQKSPKKIPRRKTRTTKFVPLQSKKHAEITSTYSDCSDKKSEYGHEDWQAKMLTLPYKWDPNDEETPVETPTSPKNQKDKLNITKSSDNDRAMISHENTLNRFTVNPSIEKKPSKSKFFISQKPPNRRQNKQQTTDPFCSDWGSMTAGDRKTQRELEDAFILHDDTKRRHGGSMTDLLTTPSVDEIEEQVLKRVQNVKKLMSSPVLWKERADSFDSTTVEGTSFVS